MNPDNTTQLVLALLGFALVAAALGWSPYGRSVWPPVSAAALAAAAVSRRSPTTSRPAGSR